MAWRSSGTNNTDMVDKLKQFGVITSDHVEEGFRKVDRKLFVPAGHASMAHSDQPLKEGHVHISAPHIYGSALEALDLVPDSATSFLNIGCGTGYVSCIAAEILGANSLNYGVELHEDVIQHAKSSIAKWKAHTVEQSDGVSTLRFADRTADLHIVQGNGLSILPTRGESVVGFDRIYIGAAVEQEDLDVLVKLLSPGGVLVGPVEDELVKVVRVGSLSLQLEGDPITGTEEDAAAATGAAGGEFTSQILSGVRFAPLSASPLKNTVIPAHVWHPGVRGGYPAEFRRAGRQLLLSANADPVQPPPRAPRVGARCNAAAMLPKTLWLEILSFTHRKWFAPEEHEADYLRRRLREEKAKVANAERLRRDAEERCLVVERERAVYRLLARRWQSRLGAVLGQQAPHDRQQEEAAENLLAMLGAAGAGPRDGDNGGARPDERATLSGLRALLQELEGGADDDEGGDDEAGDETDESAEEEPDMDVEEALRAEPAEEEESHHDLDDAEGDLLEDAEDDLLEFLAEEHDSGPEDDFLSAQDRDSDDEDDSVFMEDVGHAVATGQRGADQPRTVSMSSDDL